MDMVTNNAKVGCGIQAMLSWYQWTQNVPRKYSDTTTLQPLQAQLFFILSPSPHPQPFARMAAPPWARFCHSFFLVKGSFALLADLVISIIIVGSLHWADFAVFWHHLVHKIELNKIGWINTFMLFTPNSDSTIWMLERKLKLIRSPNVFLAFYFPFLADRSGTQCGLLLVQPICFNARCVMQSEVLFCIR